ncbi:MAG TPA: hypothetical protein VLH08_14760, partial [Acidobacteriota bacterium]|nr:hypothetical protein [Acidobacteriota bacterium]
MAEEKKEKHSRINWNYVLIAFLIFAAMGFFGDRVEIMVPLMGMLTGTAILVAPFYLWHKRKLAKQELETLQLTTASSPETETKLKRMQERVENLEAMLCNMDREINLQMEKSLNAVRLMVPSSSAGVSQMP